MAGNKSAANGEPRKSDPEQPKSDERKILEQEGWREFEFRRTAPGFSDEVAAMRTLDVPFLKRLKAPVFYEMTLDTNKSRTVCGFDSEDDPQASYNIDTAHNPEQIWSVLEEWLYRISDKAK